VVFITGAARGLGAAIVPEAHTPWRARRPRRPAAGATGGAGGRPRRPCGAFAADVSDLGALTQAAEDTVERFGGIDVVVANAAIAPPPTPS
jgi:NAD(P)-dependent dehydrogenase (short-subunit alcohol dehydrogenase family)